MKIGRISVIIPAYNAGKYIAQTIDSVLTQTYLNIECIVIDDGSTDDTNEQLAPYGNKITYVHQENRGRSTARNLGLSYATGEYLALLDADDYWAPDKLAMQLALLESDPSLGAVGCGAFVVTDAGNVIRELQAATMPRLSAGNEGFARLITLEYTIAAPLSTLVIRRSALESVGNFNEQINTMEEWDLLLRLNRSWNIDSIFEPLAFYRGYGVHVPTKVAPRRRHEKYIEVVTSQFASESGKQVSQALKDKALGLGYLRGALLEYAVGNSSAGAGRLELAWRHQPDLFGGPGTPFFDLTANFAPFQYDTVTPLVAVKVFLDRVFENLPACIAPLLSPYRSVMEGQVFSSHAFDDYQRHDYGTMRSAIRCAWRSNPKLISENLGLLSIYIESFLGPERMRLLRRLSHDATVSKHGRRST